MKAYALFKDELDGDKVHLLKAKAYGTPGKIYLDEKEKKRMTVKNKKKITPKQVHELRHEFNSGVSMKILTREFNLCENQVYRIGHNKSWHDPNYISCPRKRGRRFKGE